MENMLENFVNYNLIKDVYENKKDNILLNARELYKGRREVIIAFEEDMFPLPKQYIFGENEWKERYLGKKEFMPKNLEKSFLNESGHAPLSEKENELLNKNFGFEKIDELVEIFNNTKTEREYNELFNRITNRANILIKLVKTVSNSVEKNN